jgi:hypothetical protein
MTAILEFLGKPTEAPAAVPGSVHEDEPRHRASIHPPRPARECRLRARTL